jgi:hypothetical protein
MPRRKPHVLIPLAPSFAIAVPRKHARVFFAWDQGFQRGSDEDAKRYLRRVGSVGVAAERERRTRRDLARADRRRRRAAKRELAWWMSEYRRTRSTAAGVRAVWHVDRARSPARATRRVTLPKIARKAQAAYEARRRPAPGTAA